MRQRTAPDGRSVREAHLSFFQDGFDQSSRHGAGIHGGTGRHGRPGGGTNGGARTGGAELALGTGYGFVLHATGEAETRTGTSTAPDDVGGAFGPRGDREADRVGAGIEMAE